VSEYVPEKTSDDSAIAGGTTHTVRFRPDRPGPVGVSVTPQGEPTRSETGDLARIELRLPGASQPQASYTAPLGAPIPLVLSYTATEADLVPAGDWSCSIFNASDATLTFDTTITCIGLVPLIHATATFDIGLLNILLAEAVVAAQLGVHVETSADPDDASSYIAWSANVGTTLPGQLKNTTSYSFHIPDVRVDTHYSLATVTWVVFRIVEFDTGLGAPPSVLVIDEDGAPAMYLTMIVEPAACRIVAIDSDVGLDDLDVTVTLDSAVLTATVNFYGADVKASCQVTARAMVAGVPVDISADVSSAVQTALYGVVGRPNGPQVRPRVDTFFKNLLRLRPTDATVDGYSLDATGSTLTVSYSYPEPLGGSGPPVNPVRGSI
jgi:hypothetical protein